MVFFFFFTAVFEGLDDGRIVGSNVIFVILHHTTQHCGTSSDFALTCAVVLFGSGPLPASAREPNRR